MLLLLGDMTYYFPMSQVLIFKASIHHKRNAKFAQHSQTSITGNKVHIISSLKTHFILTCKYMETLGACHFLQPGLDQA